MKKYLWLLPALYVSFNFGSKLFEVLSDKDEFVKIISAITILSPVSTFLAYGIGTLDFIIAISLLTIPLFNKSKKYSKYIFAWTILWPFIPSSIRYFLHVADFEIISVFSVSLSAILACVLYFKLKDK